MNKESRIRLELIAISSILAMGCSNSNVKYNRIISYEKSISSNEIIEKEIPIENVRKLKK